ncbi:MAG: class I SAM-dependent methyltransferase [Deltaproteobacteria bacterium]|nr:class I SAM-dependent methyltransferase [Deltaproteobacteria bacterium]
MVKPRIIETGEGIQGELDVRHYDAMMRRMRDKGWLETDLILKAGITRGLALEVGPGPGYLGLEWLKKTTGTSLRAVEISPAMIAIARRNAQDYGLADRVEYVQGDASRLPFEENEFDGVFSNGSLHEWDDPSRVLQEIHRALKPGGRFCISDLRRDLNPLVKWFMQAVTRPKEILPGLASSLRAAYIREELEAILGRSPFQVFEVQNTLMGIQVTGRKAS